MPRARLPATPPAPGTGAGRHRAGPAGAGDGARATVGLNPVIISVDGTTPRLVTVRDGSLEALPSGHLEDAVDRTLEQGVRRLVSSEIGLPVRYFEQL